MLIFPKRMPKVVLQESKIRDQRWFFYDCNMTLEEKKFEFQKFLRKDKFRFLNELTLPNY